MTLPTSSGALGPPATVATVPLLPPPDAATSRRRARWAAGSLLLLGTLAVAALVVVHAVFVGTARGQLLDQVVHESATAWPGARSSRRLLGLVSEHTLVVACAAVAAVALLRRLPRVALVALGVVGGANVTTQLLKLGLDRPQLPTLTEWYTDNTLPSGHTTAAASLAVALVLVVPRRARLPVAVLAGGWAAVTSAATLPAGWHRPSDVVAGFLVVLAWLCVLAALAIAVPGASPGGPAARSRAGRTPRGRSTGGGTRALRPRRRRPPGAVLLAALSTAGGVLAAGALLATHLSLAPGAVLNIRQGQELDLSPVELLVAYGGAVAGVLGASALLTAVALVVADLLAPSAEPAGRRTRGARTRPRGDAEQAGAGQDDPGQAGPGQGDLGQGDPGQRDPARGRGRSDWQQRSHGRGGPGPRDTARTGVLRGEHSRRRQMEAPPRLARDAQRRP